MDVESVEVEARRGEKLRKVDEDYHPKVCSKGGVKQQKASWNATRCGYFTEYE